MDWRAKAAMHVVLSRAPFGGRLHHFVQRWLIRSFPRTDRKLGETVGHARAHAEALGKHLETPWESAVFYEFGAGWDLIVPLALYGLGVERQIVIDLVPLARPALVNDAIVRLGRLADPGTLRRSPARPIAALDDLRELYGIHYRAPVDARRTGLPERSVDCITSTNTLEHVPSGDLPAIVRECHRVLRNSGLMSCRIDYQDHYAYADRRLTAYNFLRYADARWRFLCPATHYQNRLRHGDHLAIFRAAGFEVVEERRRDGGAEDLAVLRSMSLAPRFAAHSLADLAVRHAFLVLRKSGRRT